MRVVADCHVHLYDRFDLGAALHTLARNLDQLDREAVQVGFLTERPECHFYDTIRDTSPKSLDGHYEIDVLPGGGVLALLEGGTTELLLVAGRQIATAERVEVLALATTASFPDGQPLADTLRLVQESGGVPVLSWAAGKWLGGRGRAVKALLDGGAPGRLLLGDSSLRPTKWQDPDIFREAVQRGFTLLAGSDALPVAGEERYLGQYASLFEMAFDSAQPLASIQASLSALAADNAQRVGVRCGLAEVMSRLWRYHASRMVPSRPK
jgi:hypothetical protein